MRCSVPRPRHSEISSCWVSATVAPTIPKQLSPRLAIPVFGGKTCRLITGTSLPQTTAALLWPEENGSPTSDTTIFGCPIISSCCYAGSMKRRPRPAVIEVAWLGLRRNGRVEWSAQGAALETVTFGGDAFKMSLERVLTVRSCGNDPILFLPANVPTEPPLVFDCWMRLTDGGRIAPTLNAQL